MPSPNASFLTTYRSPLFSFWLIAGLSLLGFFSPPVFSQSLSDAVNQGADSDEFLDNIGATPHPTFFDNFDINLRGTSASGFGGTGTLSTPVGSYDAAARASVVQSDGKIVVAGRVYYGGGNDDFEVIRYNPDGTLDTTFFTGGNTAISFGTYDDIGYALALQTDGKYLITGKSDLGVGRQYNFATVRLNTDGSLDTSFNSTGKITTLFTTGTEIGRAIALQTDGKSLVAGYMRLSSGSNYKFSIIRYNTDGSLDTAFNTSGQVSTQVLSSDSAILSVAIQNDGRIIGAGNAYNGTDWDFALTRYNTNGTLDTSFFSSGVTTTPIGSSNDAAYAVILMTTGQIIAAGSSYNGTNLDYALIRYNSDGSLDTSFHTNGKVTTAIGTADDVINSLGLNTDGKVWAAGYSSNGTYNKFSLVRYNTDGSLDTSFNSKGTLITSIGTKEDSAQSISMRGDGYVITAGRTNGGSAFNVAVARYNTDGTLAPSGNLDKSFGTKGALEISAFTLIGTYNAFANTALSIQSDGKFIEPGAGSSGTFFVIRLNANGTLDTSFHTTGQVVTAFSTSDGASFTAIQTDGKIVAVGWNNASDFAIARYNTDGSLDTSFNSSGTVITAFSSSAGASDCIIQADGNITVAGESGSGYALARYNTNGTLDTTFNSSGKQVTTFGGQQIGNTGIVQQTDGKLFVVGWGASSVASLARYNSDGTLDTSFLTKGTKIESNAFGLIGCTQTPDGRLLAGGTSPAAFKPIVLKYLTNGILDTSFNTTGVANGSATGGSQYFLNPLVFNSGKINALTTAVQSPGFTLQRLNSNGTLDTSFMTNGVAQQATSFSNNSTNSVGWAAQKPDGKICVTMYDNSNHLAAECFWP